MDQDKLNNQSNYWEANFSKKPFDVWINTKHSLQLYPLLKKFEDDNIIEIIELGAGLGRDTVFFAKNKIKVEALDYSSTAIKTIEEKAKDNNLSKLISTKHFDIRNKLPYEDNSINGIFSHMLYCMALTDTDIKKLNDEILRVFKTWWYKYLLPLEILAMVIIRKGYHRGKDMYENDGFIINFFSEKKVNSLLEGFKNLSTTNFEEGNFPRKLFLIQNKKI